MEKFTISKKSLFYRMWLRMYQALYKEIPAQITVCRIFWQFILFSVLFALFYLWTVFLSIPMFTLLYLLVFLILPFGGYLPKWKPQKSAKWWMFPWFYFEYEKGSSACRCFSHFRTFLNSLFSSSSALPLWLILFFSSLVS